MEVHSTIKWMLSEIQDKQQATTKLDLATVCNSQTPPMKVIQPILTLVDDHEHVLKSESNDEGFSYRQVSELSDATDEIQQESVADEEFNDLDDYDLLV